MLEMIKRIASGGDFDIEIVIIIPSSGIPISLHPAQILNITIYEDITVGAITGEMLIHNQAALSNIGPIIGEEYLKIKIRTPSVEDSEDIIDSTENPFYIYQVANKTHVGEGTEGLNLYFTSSEAMNNFRTKISKTLEGTYSDIVKKMLVDYLDCKKTCYIEPSAGVKKIVSPNLKPFDIISMAQKQAVTEKNLSPTYLFYETLNGGYHFRSLDSLYDQESKWFYTTSKAGSKVMKGGILHVLKELETLLSYNVNHNNIMNDTITGALGSKLIVHDIFNKSYSEHTYNYLDNFKDEKHLDDGSPLHSSSPINKNGNRISDFTGRVFLEPTSIKDVYKSTSATQQTDRGNYEFTAQNPDKWLQRRNSQMEKIKRGITINASVHGNTIVSAGDIVTIEVPFHTQVESNENNKLDKFLKGKFLVVRVRHDFVMEDRNHKTSLTCVRDSMPEELEFDDDLPMEIKPIEQGAEIITELYHSYEYVREGGSFRPTGVHYPPRSST